MVALTAPLLLGQAGSLLLNLVSGIGVVLANKLAFTSAQFTFPVALTTLHYATNYALLLCIAAISPPPRSEQLPAFADRQVSLRATSTCKHIIAAVLTCVPVRFCTACGHDCRLGAA